MKFKNIILVGCLAAACLRVGMLIGEQRLIFSYKNWKPGMVYNQESPMPGKVADADFAMFWRVWQRVAELYVDKNDLDPEKMIDGAISGMVAAIGDPYTVYLPEKLNQEVKEEINGSFEGVGIQLGFVQQRLAVVAPLEGTPASLAGIKPGDLILQIKDTVRGIDQMTDGISVTTAVNLIRGPKGSKVNLTLFRPGTEEPFDVELIRDTIVVKSVVLEYLPMDPEKPEGDKAAWLKLSRFGDRTQEEWREAVGNVVTNCGEKSDCRGMVLDLRNNPGGYLEMAVYIAGEFLRPGMMVVSQQYGDGSVEKNTVDRNGRLLKLPLTVLINPGSASASEILAGALADNDRATVVGEKSFGKGSVQLPEDMEDGSGIHVTIAKWLRPSGDWIDGKGIEPDVEAEAGETTDDNDWTKDPQLVRAVQLLK